jgi:internalin A
MSTKTEIFFSYAWGDNKEKDISREQVVNELYESLKKEDYNLVRDKVDLGYKGFISDFMKRIGKGDLVIVVLSEKYVKSAYCMFELYEIARNSKFEKELFREKVVPIVVEFVDFTDTFILEEHFEYWEELHLKWDKLVEKRKRQLSQEQFDRYEKIKLVHQNFGKLADWLVDMNTLSKELLSADDFKIIKENIKEYQNKSLETVSKNLGEDKNESTDNATYTKSNVIKGDNNGTINNNFS